MSTRAELPASHAAGAVPPAADTPSPQHASSQTAQRNLSRLIVDASIGLLFVKGLLLVPVTIYTFLVAYRERKPTPMAGVASCAAGTFAFTMACVAAWVRKQLD